MSRKLVLVVVLAVSLIASTTALGPAFARPSDSSYGAQSQGKRPPLPRLPRQPGRPLPLQPPPASVPTVVAAAPTGAGVAVTTSFLSATFSETMDTASAQSAFSVSPALSGSFSWSGNTMRYSPDSLMTPATQYTVTIADTAQSAAGVPLSSQVSWSFTTAADAPQLLKVSCLGDGVTEFKYPEALQVELGAGYEVGNFGSGGTCVVINNGGIAIPYLDTVVCQQSQQFQPNIVVIMLGTNDSDPAIYKHIDSFVSDYKQLIAQFQALPSNPTIWLVKPSAIFGTPYQLSNDNLVNGVIPLIQRVADEMGLSTIDCYTPTAGHPEYFRDGVHLNDTGAAVVANVIAAAIK